MLYRSAFWDNVFSVSREIPCILWNSKVHYRVHNSPPHFGILTRWVQSTPYHSLSLRFILMLSCHLRLDILVVPFFQVSPPKFYIRFSSPPYVAHATSHLTLLNLITLMWFDEEQAYKSWGSPLRGFRHPSVTSFIWSPNMILNTLFSNTLSLHFSVNWRDQVSHPYKPTSKVIVLYTLITALLGMKSEERSKYSTCWRLYLAHHRCMNIEVSFSLFIYLLIKLFIYCCSFIDTQ